MPNLTNEVIEVELEKISVGASQARQRDTKVELDDDLIHSIRKNGLLFPIILKTLDGGNYELVVGQRRFRAHQLLELPTIKARLIIGNIDDFESKKISLIENTARKEMKRADLVDTLQYFMDKYDSTSIVAEETGLSISTVRKYLRIGRFPPNVLEKIKDENISIDNAIKALDALGGDETNVDKDKLLETAQEIQKLSPVIRKKFVEIKKHEPDSSTSDVSAKAKQQTTSIEITIESSEDQMSRIKKFKDKEVITSDADAVSTLVDVGLDASDV